MNVVYRTNKYINQLYDVMSTENASITFVYNIFGRHIQSTYVNSYKLSIFRKSEENFLFYSTIIIHILKYGTHLFRSIILLLSYIIMVQLRFTFSLFSATLCTTHSKSQSNTMVGIEYFTVRNNNILLNIYRPFNVHLTRTPNNYHIISRRHSVYPPPNGRPRRLVAYLLFHSVPLSPLRCRTAVIIIMIITKIIIIFD